MTRRARLYIVLVLYRYIGYIVYSLYTIGASVRAVQKMQRSNGAYPCHIHIYTPVRPGPASRFVYALTTDWHSLVVMRVRILAVGHPSDEHIDRPPAFAELHVA